MMVCPENGCPSYGHCPNAKPHPFDKICKNTCTVRKNARPCVEVDVKSSPAGHSEPKEDGILSYDD